MILEKEKDKNDSSKSSSLYKDKYCKLKKSHIRIRTYYFPIGKDKVIKLEKIKKVYYKKQNACGDCCSVKEWGMSLTPVWWACDLGRGLRGSAANYYNVVIDTGSALGKGFTVVHIDEFLAELQQLVPVAKFFPSQLPS